MSVSLLVLLAVTGCDQQALFEKLAPTEEVEFAKRYLALFQRRDFDALEARLDPALRDGQLRAKLEQVAAFLPAEPPTAISLVGSHIVSSSGLWQASLTFQYEFPDRWLLASVNLQRSHGVLVVTSVNVRPLRDSLEHINRFSLRDASAVQYVVLGLAIAIPLFIVGVLWLCIRTPIPKRKWLWMIFVLLGFVQVGVNWTTREIYVNPISFLLLGSAFWKAGPHAPVVITVSLPVGAVLFILRRRRWVTGARPTVP